MNPKSQYGVEEIENIVILLDDLVSCDSEEIRENLREQILEILNKIIR